jgi:hypothetical protein
MPLWLGSICAAILGTGGTGFEGNLAHLLPAGGCDVAEPPDLDSRAAHPQWLSSSDCWLQVRAAHARTAGAPHFDLWRVPGRKRLTLEGANLALSADLSAQRMRVSLAGDVAHGVAYTSMVPLMRSLRSEFEWLLAQAQALDGQLPSPMPARAAGRAGLLHLRALQALDGSLAGASHRDIAKALFGLEAVVLRWHEDSELRAQVRHLLRRAKHYMNGGYLVLAGVQPTIAKHPGDEAHR